MSIPQQINFAGKLDEDDGAKMFFIAENQEKNYSKIFFRLINCNRIKWNIVNDQSNVNFDELMYVNFFKFYLKFFFSSIKCVIVFESDFFVFNSRLEVT